MRNSDRIEGPRTTPKTSPPDRLEPTQARLHIRHWENRLQRNQGRPEARLFALPDIGTGLWLCPNHDGIHCPAYIKEVAVIGG